MIKSGHFIVKPWKSKHQISAWFKRGAYGWERQNNAIPDETANEIFMPIVNSNFETASMELDNFIGAVRVKSQGKPTPPIPPIVVNWPSIRENNNPFMKKRNSGEIVVSNYMSGAHTIRFVNGGRITRNGDPYTVYVPVQKAYYVHRMYSVEDISVYRNCLVVDDIAIFGNFCFERCASFVTDDRTVFDNGYVLPDDDFIYRNLTVDNNTVTTNTANANRGSVDILTSLAEMPETLKSIINGLATIARMYRDAKKKELRLYNKGKRERIDYDEAVLALGRRAEEIENDPQLSRRQKRRLILKITKDKRQLKLTLKKNLDETASALADVWLNYRYNIMPNVYLIEGALDSIDNKTNVFARWSEKLKHTLSFPYYDNVILIEERAFIKRRFDVARLSNSFSLNPFLTAWELVPLSFVVDWAVNIGNAIAALTFTPSGISQEGATYSWKVSGMLSKTYEDGSSVTIECRGYKRVVIDPSLYCRLSWNPDLTPKRKLDALALTWNIALKRLLK